MKRITLFADGVGALEFDGVHAVVSALDPGCPEIRRVTTDTLDGARTQSVGVGGSTLILEGYLLDEAALSDGAQANGVADGALVAKLKKKLSSVASPGRPFTLTVDGRSRELYATSLSFAAEAPFTSPHAESFRLAAYSDDPYFHGGEIAFAGIARVNSPLFFPASGEFTTGEQRKLGDVVIDNDGDETCGFVLEATFPAGASEFILSSDRESGRAQLGHELSSGDTVVIDTRKGHRDVRLSTGESLLSSVNEKCAFFAAPPGKTKLSWTAIADAPPSVTARIVPGYLFV